MGSFFKVWGYGSKYGKDEPLLVEADDVDKALKLAREIDPKMCAVQMHDKRYDKPVECYTTMRSAATASLC